MVRKRRRQRFTWMPTLGGVQSNGDSAYGTASFGTAIDASAPWEGPQDLYVTSLVPDYTLYPDGAPATVAGDTLRDFTEGQDWLLKRIVGRLNVGVAQINALDTATPKYIEVGAGFYVGRADDNSQDSPDTESSGREIDPLASQNIRQPWIWRRTWLLTNFAATATGGKNTYVLPASNFGYGQGAVEGPVIDTKIARRIRREERLWFVINAYGYDNLQGGEVPGFTTHGNVFFHLDYRILGAMRKSNNRSTF